MTDGQELLERVRTAQEELGAGDPEVALELVEPLLDETRAALRSLEFPSRSKADRTRIVEAFCYARVTAVLALESAGAAEALPRIRILAGEAMDAATEGNPCWKALSAAAEMLARGGDAAGAVRAVERAAELAPEDEHYVRQLRGSIRSMFPETAGSP